MPGLSTLQHMGSGLIHCKSYKSVSPMLCIIRKCNRTVTIPVVNILIECQCFDWSY